MLKDKNDDNYFSKESFKESEIYIFSYSEAQMKVISLMIP